MERSDGERKMNFIKNKCANLGVEISISVFLIILGFGFLLLGDYTPFKPYLKYIGGSIMIIFGLYILLIFIKMRGLKE